MSKVCTKCLLPMPDNSEKCPNCGAFCNTSNPVRSNAQGTLSILKVIVIVVLISIPMIRMLIYNYGPRMDTSWVVKDTCTEMKSEVYNEYGEIPNISGKIIYENHPDYIVVVKYTLPEWGWEGSRACHVYGYREDICHVSGKTREMPYDYDYVSMLDELKAMWALK